MSSTVLSTIGTYRLLCNYPIMGNENPLGTRIVDNIPDGTFRNAMTVGVTAGCFLMLFKLQERKKIIDQSRVHGACVNIIRTILVDSLLTTD